jgi:hypothetical protein
MTGDRAALALVFTKLHRDWEDARQNWKDERAAMFDQSIIQHVGSHAARLNTEFDDFLTLASDIQAEMEHLGFQAPHHDEQEIANRQVDAKTDWQDAGGPARTRFGLDFGQFGHARFEEELLRREEASGRVRNVDFGIEYILNHPDGGQVRYDYVDLKTHQIIDYKSAKAGQTTTDVANDHRAQRQRHIQAYVAAFGFIPSYTYATYPSTSNLYLPDSDDGDHEHE